MTFIKYKYNFLMVLIMVFLVVNISYGNNLNSSIVEKIDFIDQNNNFLIDYINLSLNKSILIDNNYSKIEFLIGNYDGNLIGDYNFNLIEYNKSLNFKIDSKNFYNSKLDGPYKILVLNLYSNSNLNDERKEIIKSEYNILLKDNLTGREFYSYLDFERNLADLSILNLSYNNFSKKLNIKIKNIGNLDAVYFSVRVYDLNLSLLDEDYVNYLEINKSMNIIFSLKNNSNLSQFMVYLNENNLVDEKTFSNNILIWPINLSEVCGDGFDNNRNGLIDENCLIDNLSYKNMSFESKNNINIHRGHSVRMRRSNSGSGDIRERKDGVENGNISLEKGEKGMKMEDVSMGNGEREFGINYTNQKLNLIKQSEDKKNNMLNLTEQKEKKSFNNSLNLSFKKDILKFTNNSENKINNNSYILKNNKIIDLKNKSNLNKRSLMNFSNNEKIISNIKVFGSISVIIVSIVSIFFFV